MSDAARAVVLKAGAVPPHLGGAKITRCRSDGCRLVFTKGRRVEGTLRDRDRGDSANSIAPAPRVSIRRPDRKKGTDDDSI